MKETLTGRYRLLPSLFGGVRVEVETKVPHLYYSVGYVRAPMGMDEIVVWRRAKRADLIKLGTHRED